MFQPFFLQADLPYSAIRGEEFPVKVALYNYLDAAQDIQVELEAADWFDATRRCEDHGDRGRWRHRQRRVHHQARRARDPVVKVTARSSEAADAMIKSMIVEPEGVQPRDGREPGAVRPGQSNGP